MPTYEYKCDACDHRFERFQSMKDKPVKTCPECGKRRVKRLISAGAGVVFKGSGFYTTDYRDSGRKAGGSKSGDAKSGDSSGGKDGGKSGESSGKSGDSGGSAGTSGSGSAD